MPISKNGLDPLAIGGRSRIFKGSDLFWGRRGAGVADRAGLENRCGACTTEGSNPSLSALLKLANRRKPSSLLLASSKSVDPQLVWSQSLPLSLIERHRQPQNPWISP